MQWYTVVSVGTIASGLSVRNFVDLTHVWADNVATAESVGWRNLERLAPKSTDRDVKVVETPTEPPADA